MFRPQKRVPNFSQIKARIRELYRDLHKVQKEGKMKKFLQNFADSYLGNRLRDLASPEWRLTPQ